MDAKREHERTRIERLLNYKRYIDFLVERELKRIDQNVKRKRDDNQT